MADSTINDTIVLSKDVINGLQEMLLIGNAIITKHKDDEQKKYAAWSNAFNRSAGFWQEIAHHQKIMAVIEHAETLEATKEEVLVLHEFMSQAGSFIEQMKQMTEIGLKFNNATYQYQNLIKFNQYLAKKKEKLIK